MDTPRLRRVNVGNNAVSVKRLQNLKESTPSNYAKSSMKTPFAKTPHFKTILGERTNNQTPKLVHSRPPLPKTGRKKQIEVYKDEETDLKPMMELEVEYCPPPLPPRTWEPDDEIEAGNLNIQMPKYCSEADAARRKRISQLHLEYQDYDQHEQFPLDFELPHFEPSLDLNFESFQINI